MRGAKDDGEESDAREAKRSEDKAVLERTYFKMAEIEADFEYFEDTILKELDTTVL